jgi:hypothetical protein
MGIFPYTLQRVRYRSLFDYGFALPDPPSHDARGGVWLSAVRECEQICGAAEVAEKEFTSKMWTVGWLWY